MANKTISAAIVEMFDNLGFTIHTNHLSDGSDKYGIFRSPARLKVENIDGSYTVTEAYQFYGRLDSLSETEREDAEEQMEALVYAVDDYIFNYDWPELTGNRTIQDVEITGCPYPIETTDEDLLYQISLNITYVRERS